MSRIVFSTALFLVIMVPFLSIAFILWHYAQQEYGYIDLTGKLILRPKVDVHHGFHESAAAVAIHKRWGFIDKTGKFIIEPQFQGVGFFSDGLAAAEDTQGKWGFIDKSGQFIIAPKYEDVLNFSEGLAAVKVNGLYFFINTNGDPVIDHRYRDATCFSNGLALVTNGKESFYIDHTGKTILLAYTYPAYIAEGPWHSAIKDGYLDERNSYFDYEHNSHFGSMVSSNSPEIGLPLFSEGLVATWSQNDGFQGYMDIHGKEVIPAWSGCRGMSSFSEGLAYVNRMIGTYSESYFARNYEFIDKSGKTILRLNNDYPLSSFNNGFALIGSYGMMGFVSKRYYIDKKGKKAFGRTFDYAEPFSEGLAAVGKK